MAARTPPRFVTRTMATTFATVVFILGAVLLVVTLMVRTRVRENVIDHLTRQQSMLWTLEKGRLSEMRAQAEMLAESPTVKAAMDTYHAESRLTGDENRQLLDTVARELDHLAQRINPDILTVSDPSGRVVAAAGGRKADWPATVGRAQGSRDDEFVVVPAGVFRVATAPLVVQGAEVGLLQLGTAIDAAYAKQLSDLSGAGTLITSRGSVVASSKLPDAATRALTQAVLTTLPELETVNLGGQQYAIRLLLQGQGVAIYSLDSIDASAAAILNGTLSALGLIALCSLAVAGYASLWLARTLARPIDTLSRSLTALTTSREFERPVAPSGSSLEVDTLTTTFNTLMATVSAAEADTRSAYVGAIRALALALDARDPYTAGHSERVSAISVAAGRQLGLKEEDLDTLRLGALLHDIGKIGISDDVLRKPGPLTPAEFEVIKEHPVTGARILRTVPFLASHLPIVELHHERPDGKGYPHGLHAAEIPVLARIVHVADAFDAISSARAYRPARSGAEALQELWKCAGSQFDAECVQALASAIPTLRLDDNHFDTAAARAARKSALVAFTRS
jgi:putative nucleotidyltransferase with HDIG domain